MAERPIIDLDHHTHQYADTYHEVADELRASECPVRWSEHHGGFWATPKPADIARVARDDEFFTQNNDREGTARGGSGVRRPSGPVCVPPIESEPPFTQLVRQLCRPAFAPAGAKEFEPTFPRMVTECLDAVVESGSIDFSEDLTAIATVRGTMYLIGLPEDRVPLYAKVADESSYLAPGDPGFDESMAGIGEIQADVVKLVQDQKANPVPVLTSRLLAGEINGVKLSDDEE